METSVKLDLEVFLDSAYLIALAHPGDEHHIKARQISDGLNAAKTRIITSRAILIEVGNGLSKLRFRRSAVSLIESLQRSLSVEIVPLGESLCEEGWRLFRERTDKEWSWVDCISFVIMHERGLKQALTTDEHFEQAGFIALLHQ